MSDGSRSLDEAWRAIDDLRTERREYVRKDVYIAERDAGLARTKRLEDDDTSKASGNRTWLLGLAQAAFGALLGLLAAYLLAKGQG